MTPILYRFRKLISRKTEALISLCNYAETATKTHIHTFLLSHTHTHTHTHTHCCSPDVGRFLSVNSGLPFSHYYRLPSRDHTHSSHQSTSSHSIPPSLSIPSHQSPPVWLTAGLSCSPYFHPNCLTPTGTLQDVWLCSLLWAHTSACTSWPWFYTIHYLFSDYFSAHKIRFVLFSA